MFIVGHRGARGLAPENTQKAVRIGMDCAEFIEVDVRLTLDRVPVVIHDSTVDRTTDGTGPVGTISYRDLRTLDAGDGEHIPDLREICDLVSGRCGLFVEMKEQGSEPEVCSIIGRAAPEPLWIVSFHLACLEKVGVLLPQAKLGLIYSRDDGDHVNLALSTGIGALLPRSDMATRELVESAHRNGIVVVPWTLNIRDEWDRAFALGADGFATDDPCSALRWRRSRQIPISLDLPGRT